MAKMTLEQLASQLQGAFGEALESIVVYGSAAVDHGAAAKDVNLLVTVSALDLARLDAASAAVRAWTEGGQPAPFILTTREWRGSADIFPMEYADILDRHRVLYGTPPFDGVNVAAADLRRQLEQDAMGKLLHLRRETFAAAGDSKRQLQLLEASRSAILVLFRAVLRLTGQVPPADDDRLCAEAAAVVGFDPLPFQRVAKHRRGGADIPRDQAGSVLGAYLAGVERLVHYLDTFDASAR